MDKKDTKIKGSEETIAKYFKYGVIALVALLVIAVGLIVYFNYSGSYVAMVGSEKISVGEFNFFLNQTKKNMLSEAQAADFNIDVNTFWTTKINGENALELAKKKTLDSLRELKIQVIKAKEQKVELTKEQLSSLDDMVKSFSAQYKNKAEADAKAKELYGASLEEVTNYYKQVMLIQELMKKETEGIKVSEDEINAYYEKNPDKFKQSDYRNNGEEAVWVKHILVMTVDQQTQQELPADKLEAAKKKAEDLLARAKNGEDFAKLAKENSEDPGSASYGGDYVFGKGKMDPAFEKTSFELNPGEISGLVKTQYGYHIIKVEEKIAKDQPVSLRCAKEYWEYNLNEDYVKSEKYQQKLDEWKKDPKFDAVKNEGVYSSIE